MDILFFILVSVLLGCVSLNEVYAAKFSKPHIAVVGAGIGGTSTAYFLQDLFGQDALIDVYEAGEIGGRIATVKVDDRHYESGASIFHPRNEYLVNFTEILGLKKRTGIPNSRLGLYDGKGFPFSSSSWSVLTLGNILWRYGMDFVNINSYVNEMIGNFSRIYSHQEKGEAFTTVENLLTSMCPEFVELTKIPSRQHFTDIGISQLFIDEFLTAALRVNYGQGTDTQAFVGSMSIAGVQPGLWAVAGGNKLIPEKLLSNSKVKVINGKVTRIKHDSHMENYELFYEQENEKLTNKYDIVILATPLLSNNLKIEFEGFKDKIPNFEMPYHRTVATFLKGTPNIKHFGFTSLEEFTEAIMSIDHSTYFNSFARNFPTDCCTNSDGNYSSQVFKVFSQKPLTDAQKEELMMSCDEEQVVDWLAYPHYSIDSKNLPPFVLYDNLYFVNGIESASSAAEVVVIGARNVANLAYNNWNNFKEKIDKFKTQKISIGRNEL